MPTSQWSPLAYWAICVLQPCLGIHKAMTIVALSQSIQCWTFIADLQTLVPYFFHGPIVFFQQIPRFYWTHGVIIALNRLAPII